MTSSMKQVFSETVCKELNAANNHVSMEGDPSPVEPQIDPVPDNTLIAALWAQ